MAGQGILSRLRLPGRLEDPDAKDLSLVARAANKEKVIMAKKEGENVYDFSKIGDPTKNALALSYEAIKDNVESLPDEVGEFFKSAAEELDLDTTIVELKKAEHPDESEEEKKKRLEDLKKAEEEAEVKKTEMIKSAFPGVLEAAQKAVVDPLQIEIKKAQDEITALTDRLRRDEMRALAKELTPGDDEPSDGRVDELITIQKSMNGSGDSKAWDAYVESQRGLVTQIEKGILFERQVNPAAAAPGSAYEQIQSIANSIVEKSEDKNPSKAWEHAVATNPTLYEQYRKEQAAQAKAGVAA